MSLPTISGGWRCLIADPPWRFSDRGSRIAPEKCAAPYETMTGPAIAAMPVREIAAPDAVLSLWTPDTHLPIALSIADAWGFTYRHLIVWTKVTKAGRPHIGMGHYFRKAHEVALLCTRGKPAVLARDIPSAFFAPRGRHSAKPADLHVALERFCEGPRLELFARTARAGWTAWGDQAPKTDRITAVGEDAS